MAAMTTRLLHLRPVVRPQPYNTLRHFSSDTTEREREPEPKPQTQTSSKFSYLNDVKASLRRESPPQNRPFKPPLSFSNPNNPNPPPPPSKLSSLEGIRRNLSEFRHRSAPPPPPSPQQEISFQELYKRNVISKSDVDPTNSSQPPSHDVIRESIRKLKASAPPLRGNDGGGKGVDQMSLARFKESLTMKPDSRVIIGGSDATHTSLPSSIFSKEMKEDVGGSGGMRTAFMRSYPYAELGERLKMLRPDKKKGKKFSLQELNDRLASLRDMEERERESQSKVGGLPITELRDCLVKLTNSKDEKDRVKTMQRLDVLSQLGGTPSFMLSPPKEHLVEKYFHPDNMSSAEKLKLELKKVRDEFKMSESDCGSARVQVAQLTTKIKHLSSVLQKKDKHSRKGLQAMVQRRKKLLKYLRRTDWDSYSLVLSKLGLRDNPDIKA